MVSGALETPGEMPLKGQRPPIRRSAQHNHRMRGQRVMNALTYIPAEADIDLRVDGLLLANSAEAAHAEFGNGTGAAQRQRVGDDASKQDVNAGFEFTREMRGLAQCLKSGRDRGEQHCYTEGRGLVSRRCERPSFPFLCAAIFVAADHKSAQILPPTNSTIRFSA